LSALLGGVGELDQLVLGESVDVMALRGAPRQPIVLGRALRRRAVTAGGGVDELALLDKTSSRRRRQTSIVSPGAA
jgi:hypothetical protein